MIPGEYHVASEPIDYNGGYEAISLEVKNVGCLLYTSRCV